MIRVYFEYSLEDKLELSKVRSGGRVPQMVASLQLEEQALFICGSLIVLIESIA